MSENVIGPYRVLRPIKRGGGGSVYVGFDRRLNRRVALKFLTIPESAEQRTYLIAEAQSLAQINNRLIVQIYDIVEYAENLVLVLEYVEGCDLAELANACSLEPQEVLQIGIETSGALAAIHECGIVHRDIKASNVLMDLSGRVKLTDFGIAVSPEKSDGADTRSGSYSALAPEQLVGGVPSVRSDLFSLGAMLYRLLSGCFPFGSPDHPKQLIARLAVGEFQPLDQRMPGLLPPLAHLVDEMLAFSAEDRPESAVIVRQRLAAMRSHLPLLGGQSVPIKVASCARPEDAVIMEAGLARRSGQAARSHLLSDRQWRPWVAAFSRDSKWLMLSGFLLLLLIVGVMREAGRWRFQTIDVSLRRPQVMFSEDSLSGPSASGLQALLQGAVREKAGLRISEFGAPEVVSANVQCHSSSCGLLVQRIPKGSDTRSYYSTILRDAPDAAWRSEFRVALDQLFD